MMQKSSRHFYYPFEKDGTFSYSRTAIGDLSEYEKYQLSFHPERPKYLDYLTIFDRLEVCLESDEFGARLIQTHRADFTCEAGSFPVMLIGQQTGPTSDYGGLIESMKDPAAVKAWNHGMPTPASYERAVRAIELANREGRLVITVVDTPGADPTEESEAGGIAWKIGRTIQELVEASVPTLSIILNRGCSGGAIALTGCDVILAMEHSTYLVITPEACSSILFHSRTRANEAAEISRITSREGLALGIVDELVPEPDQPAHRNPDGARESLREVLARRIPELAAVPSAIRFDRRVERWAGIGSWSTVPESDVLALSRPVSRIPAPPENGFFPRHSKCYDKNKVRRYDPVRYTKLSNNNFVCADCGHKYIRPSVWNYMDIILDQDSFREHPETRTIADKDILGFPGYPERLAEVRAATGLMSNMITGDANIDGIPVMFCGTDFGFLGGSFCMSAGEKIWRVAEMAIRERKPVVIQASGGGARMHEGCSSMVSIPKAQLAITRVERAGLPVITLITDPTLGGVAIGYGSRGIRFFEANAGNIGFSGKRVIEQYTRQKTSRNFQKTHWLERHGHVEHVGYPETLRRQIADEIRRFVPVEKSNTMEV